MVTKSNVFILLFKKAAVARRPGGTRMAASKGGPDKGLRYRRPEIPAAR